MKRIWDIIDRTQPGVEITQPNDKRIRFDTARTNFTLSIALGAILATSAAFLMPIPTEAAVISAVTQSTQLRGGIEPPFSASLFAGAMSIERENELLDAIEQVRHQPVSAQVLRFDVLETNQQESLKNSTNLSRSDIEAIFKKRA